MATERLPSYVNKRRLASGRTAYYWVRPAWAAPPAERNGQTCQVMTTALGTDLADAIRAAECINEAFAEWRIGAERRITPGTVRWLFDWYRKDERFTAKRHKTRSGYRDMMNLVEAIPVRSGTVGQQQVKLMDATSADKLYRIARDTKGERQASYMMQVCRLVWNQALRHGKATGVKENPFAGMGIKSTAGGKGNRAATRAEYDAYRAAAREMGRQSMATAAALCFECCQRVWDAFGFVDPDKRVERGIRWEDYSPGERLSLVQSKTGNLVTIPLSETIGGEAFALYPELEEELARTPRSDGLIVRDERTGLAYTTDYMPKIHRRIRERAGLPSDLKFTSFRHGGITEIGNTGEADVRAISGHTTLDTTRIYNKASVEKAVRIASKRREHIAMIAGEGRASP